MLNAAADSPIVTLDQTFYVLIPSRFPPIALYERIANGNHDEIAAIETLTNPRLAEKQRLISHRPDLDEKSPSLQNWNHAPFAYPNPEGSRFFGPETPCLELSGDRQTALAVSVVKRQVFLERTKEGRLSLDMRMLSRKVKGKFLDGRDWPIDMPAKELRELGKSVLKLDVEGVLFRSAERPAGERVAIRTGSSLDAAVQGDHYRYLWDGSRIGSLYAFNDGAEIDPELLGRDESILAA